jgi:hypothetical protein
VRWILPGSRPTGKTQPPFARTYAQIAHRRGRQIATVAIARKLLARCFHILAELEEPTTRRRHHRARSRFRMCLQHGR